MAHNFIKTIQVTDLAPGKMTTFDIAGRDVLIANVDGEFLAADDMCTHEDVSLCNGALMGDRVMCPYHGSRFSLRTGEVTEDPAEEDLPVFPVEVRDGAVWVAVD